MAAAPATRSPESFGLDTWAITDVKPAGGYTLRLMAKCDDGTPMGERGGGSEFSLAAILLDE